MKTISIFVAFFITSLFCLAGLANAQPTTDPPQFGIYMKNDPCVENRMEWIVVAEKNPTGGGNSYLTARGSRTFHHSLASANAEQDTIRVLTPAAETGMAELFKKYCCKHWNIWEDTRTKQFAVAKENPGAGWIRDVTSPTDMCCEEAFALANMNAGCRDVTLSNGHVLRFTLVDGEFTFVPVGPKAVIIPGLPGKPPTVFLPADGTGVDGDTVIEIPPPPPPGDGSDKVITDKWDQTPPKDDPTNTKPPEPVKPTSGVDVSGFWDFSQLNDKTHRSNKGHVQFFQEGTALSGYFLWDNGHRGTIKGTVSGNTIEFNVVFPDNSTWKINGTVSTGKDEILGDATANWGHVGQWRARFRQKNE